MASQLARDGVNDGTDGTIEYGVSTNFFAMDLSQAGTLYWGEGGSNEDFIGGDEDGFYVYASRDGDLKIERTYDTAVMTEPKILMVRLGATAQECQVLVNGAEPTASSELTLDLGATSFERTEWFGYRDGDYPIGGFVFEHALFNRALTDEEVAGLLVGLNDKWAIY